MKKAKIKMKNIGDKGIALYMAITITSALVLVAFAIISLALRQISISSAGRDSQVAFYAADSGTECALYWDDKTLGGSAFASTSPVTISCNQDSNNPTNPPSPQNVIPAWVSPVATSTFTINFLPDPYCATVTVVKTLNGSTMATKIESRGYNTCDPTSIRRVERAIRINY